MIEPAPDSAQKKRRNRWVWAALLAVILVSFGVYRVSSHFKLKQAVAAVHARGLPTSPEELNAWYKSVPAESNAALVFLEAAALYVKPLTNPTSMRVTFQPSQDLPLDLAAAIEQHVTANRKTIDRLHAAGSLPESRYPINFLEGFLGVRAYPQYLKDLAQLLRWEAVYQSANGRTSESLRALKTLFALGRSLQNEPLIISEMFRTAIVGNALRALEDVLSRLEFDDAALRDINEAILRAEDTSTRAIRRALIGERAAAVSLFKMDGEIFQSIAAADDLPHGEVRNIIVGKSRNDPSPSQAKFVYYRARQLIGLADRDLTYYFARMAEMESAATLDFPQMLTEFQRIKQKVQKDIAAHPMAFWFSRLLLPATASAAEKEAIHVAGLRCARAAIAAALFRQDSGRDPHPRELVPAYLKAIPADPIDGTPLAIQSIEGGILVKSSAATRLRNRDKENEAEFREVSFTIRWAQR
jgi:hypothetical protein